MADEQDRRDATPDAGRQTDAGAGEKPRPASGTTPTGKGKDDPSEAPESGDKKATG